MQSAPTSNIAAHLITNKVYGKIVLSKTMPSTSHLETNDRDFCTDVEKSARYMH